MLFDFKNQAKLDSNSWISINRLFFGNQKASDFCLKNQTIFDKLYAINGKKSCDF